VWSRLIKEMKEFFGWESGVRPEEKMREREREFF